MKSPLRLPALLLALAACSSDAAPSDPTGPDAASSTPDAASASPDATASPDAALDACATGPTVARGDLIAASVATLREAFEVDAGFEGGDVVYGEMWVALNDGGCPLADWSALGYYAPIDPALVPAELTTTRHVAVMWTLGGRRFVVYLDGPEAGPLAWQAGRLPDSIAAVPRADADPDDLDALVASLTADHPALTVTWLDAIGLLTIDAVVGDFGNDDPEAPRVTARATERAAAAVRASGLFTAIDWSGMSFRIPYEVRGVRVVEDAVLGPECLRDESRPLLAAFTTEPALPPPLGPGPRARVPVCE